HGDVFRGGQGGKQVVVLKDEADVTVAKDGEGSAASLRHLAAGDRHAALGRPVEEAEDGKERRFAATRRAYQSDALAGRNVEVDAGEGGHLSRRARVVHFPDAPQRSDEGLGHGRLRRRWLVRGVVADHHGGSTSMVGFLRKWGARMKPATKPPMCAQKAGPPAGMATRARAPCASWMRNQKTRKMTAGTSARCKKKK